MRELRKTILVIEDESSLSDILKDELTEQGFRCITASNGIEGLALIQDVEPDLIICDRAMPAMTGYELLERLRGVYPQYASVPFIFLTALTEESDKKAVEHLQPAAYLSKPLDFDLLLDTINNVMNS